MKLKMSVIFVSLIAIIQVALLSIMVAQDGFSSLILALFVMLPRDMKSDYIFIYNL